MPDYHDDGTGLSPSVAPATPLSDEDRKAIKDRARNALRLFARPGVAEEIWWADLEPYLSPAAQEAYVGTDPTNVPVTSIAGPVEVVEDASSEVLAIVHVPTNAGLYAVTMTRGPGGADWVVERFTPPEDVGD